MADENRELDKQVAEKYFDMGWIEEKDGELHGWNWHPCDIRYPEYTSYYYGTVPRYSADPEAAALVERKIEEFGCRDEYARALEAQGARRGEATPEQRCRAAIEIHAVYEQRVKEHVEASSAEMNRVYREEVKKADAVVSAVRARLVRLAEERPFRFVNTYREDAEEYLQSLTRFEGYGEEEMYGLRVGGLFPHVYGAYLKQMGRASGGLFAGSEADPERLPEYYAAAEEMLERCGVESFLDRLSVVFLLHQGYSFLYFQSRDIEVYDSPVYQYTECDPAPKQVAAGFAELLDAEVALMEENNRREREAGGYLITVAGGYTRRVYPALGEGARPLDVEDHFL